MAHLNLVMFCHYFPCILLVQCDQLHFMTINLMWDTLKTGSNTMFEQILVEPSRSTGSEHIDMDLELYSSLYLVAKVIILG
jgi:hypothetical protein